MDIENTEKVAVRAVLDAYEAAYLAAFEKIQRAKRSDDYAYDKARKKLLQEVAALFARMRDDIGGILFTNMEAMSAYADELAQLEMDVRATAEGGVVGAPNLDVINAVYADSFAHVAGHTDRMTNAVKVALRQDTRDISRRALTEGLTRPKAYRLLRDTVLARDPDFTFVDRRGRRWQSKDYFEMLTRTVLHNTMRETYVDSMVKEGRDLARVSRHGSECPLCASWEGGVVSLTGKTEGYPTLADADGAGLFHPRCRHRLVACCLEVGGRG